MSALTVFNIIANMIFVIATTMHETYVKCKKLAFTWNMKKKPAKKVKVNAAADTQALPQETPASPFTLLSSGTLQEPDPNISTLVPVKEQRLLSCNDPLAQ